MPRMVPSRACPMSATRKLLGGLLRAGGFGVAIQLALLAGCTRSALTVPNADLGAADFGVRDLGRDLGPVDLAVPDQASPDFAVDDLAQPDLTSGDGLACGGGYLNSDLGAACPLSC